MYLESPPWFTIWFSLIFKKLWLVNDFFWLIHQSLISWFYYLTEYSGVWSVINHVATYQYWETLMKLWFWLIWHILGLLWEIAFSKMVINGIFLDLEPLKRYQWQPNTWAKIIWGQLSQKYPQKSYHQLWLTH